MVFSLATFSGRVRFTCRFSSSGFNKFSACACTFEVLNATFDLYPKYIIYAVGRSAGRNSLPWSHILPLSMVQVFVAWSSVSIGLRQWAAMISISASSVLVKSRRKSWNVVAYRIGERSQHRTGCKAELASRQSITPSFSCLLLRLGIIKWDGIYT